MSIKKTLLFLLILAVLGGYYYIVEVRMAEQHKMAEQAEKRLFDLKEADIQEISLIRQDDTIVLQQQHDVWTLVEPVVDAVDTSAVEGVITNFANAERAQTIAETPSELAQFGLDTPELVVMVKTHEGTATTLTLGQKAPTTSAYYARVNDDAAVFTVDSGLKTGLEKTVYDLRDKTVLAFEPPQIAQATFTFNDAETGITHVMTLEQQHDEWTITGPAVFDADAAKMGSLLSTIKSADIQAFVAEKPGDFGQYGLDPPRAQLTLVVENDPAQKSLLLGKNTADETGIYAKHADAPAVFLVSPDIFEEFPRSVNDLRDKTLLSYRSDQVQKVELFSEDDEILVLEGQIPAPEDAGARWNIVHPQTYAAVPSKVHSWLWEVQELKVEQFVTDEPADLSLYGLEPPRLSVKIWSHDQEQPQELLLGNADVENTGRYARLGSQDTVVLVKPEALEMLTKTPHDFRNRKILDAATDAIEKIRIVYPDTTLVLERNGDLWYAQEPEQQELTGYKVNNVLYDIGALEFIEELSTPEANLSVYGLDQPEVEITLWEEDKQKRITIRIGRAVEERDERYLKRADMPTLYAIESSFLQELPESLADLVD